MKWFALGAMALVVAGCRNVATVDGSVTVGAPKATPGVTVSVNTLSALAGEWVAKPIDPAPTKPAGEKEDTTEAAISRWAGSFANSVMSKLPVSQLRLIFPTSDTFELSMMGIPMTGSATRVAGKLTLHVEKVLGKTPEEYRKEKEAGKEEDVTFHIGKSDTIVFEVLESESKLKLIDPDEKDQSGLVFVRKVREPEGPSVVTSEEQPLVGDWHATEQILAEGEKKTEDEFDPSRMDLSLHLAADRKFILQVPVEMQGTWKRLGDELELKMTNVLGIGIGDTGDAIKVAVKGDELRVSGVNKGRLLVFKKRDIR